MTDQQRILIERELQQLHFARDHALELDPMIPEYNARIAALEAQLAAPVSAPRAVGEQADVNAVAASSGEVSVPPWILHVLLIVAGFVSLLFYASRRSGQQSEQKAGDSSAGAAAAPRPIAEWMPK
jgi:hypothetical protein